MLSSLGLKPSNVTSLIDTEHGFKCTHCASSFATRALRDAHRRQVKRLEKIADEQNKGEVGGLTDVSDTEQ
jgi:hypothetical protein